MAKTRFKVFFNFVTKIMKKSPPTADLLCFNDLGAANRRYGSLCPPPPHPPIKISQTLIIIATSTETGFWLVIAISGPAA
jgi:hypothetical protein